MNKPLGVPWLELGSPVFGDAPDAARDELGAAIEGILNGNPDPRITRLESALRNTLELMAAVYDESNPIYSAVKKVANRALEGKSE